MVGVKGFESPSLTFSSSSREQKRPKDLAKYDYLGDISLSLNMTVVILKIGTKKSVDKIY